MPIELPIVSRKKYNEVADKLERLFSHATGGRSTKATYDLEGMCEVVDAYREQCIDRAVCDVKVDFILKNRYVDSPIRNTPDVDMVEVVRCKDCKYWGLTYTDKFPQTLYCHRDNMCYKPLRTGNDFCSLGERREENDNSRTN